MSLSKRFPHASFFRFGAHSLNAEDILQMMHGYLTPERNARIDKAVDGRSCDLVPVLENIYDRGNISAVLRSAEAMGCQCAHLIEISEKYKTANRVTQGADKWLDVRKWQSSEACVSSLKELGYQVLATHLDPKAKPIGEIDFTRPTAIVFGNEKDGISKEMIEAADQTVIIPMQGFVQSFNISVAAAIALYHAYHSRTQRLGQFGNLSQQEKLILRAVFSLRSTDNPERLVMELMERRK